MALADKGADDIHPDDLLAKNPTGPVQQVLALTVERNQPPDNQVHDQQEQGHDDDHHQGQRNILLHGQDDAAYAHGGPGKEHGEDKHREGLDLLDIVGGADGQALCSEQGHVLGGQGLDPGENLGPQAVPDPHGHHRPEVAGSNGGRCLHHGNDGHEHAKARDHPRLPCDNPVIDNGGVHGGQQQVCRRLDQLKENDRPYIRVLTGKLPLHESDQQNTPCKCMGRRGGQRLDP